MGSALTAERVRRDVDVLASAGLDLATFLDETQASLQRVFHQTATCMDTIDPATSIFTSGIKFGDLNGRDEHDIEWGLIEFGGEEPTSYAEIHERGELAVGMSIATAGDLNRSVRMRQCITPHFGYGDELRVVADVDGRMWGSASFFRSHDDEPFSAEEVAFASTLSTALARGIRCGLLANATHAVSQSNPAGPAVIIVGADDRVSQISLGAEQRLRDIATSEQSGSPMGTIAALVASARRLAAGETGSVPRARQRLQDGSWVILHGSPLARRDGTMGEVVITIEDARPPEIVPLIVEAFGLTTRERDVAQLVLQGSETKEIAGALHVSAYTVQDHLKSIFTKADVRSRRELIAKVFFDQYQPRIGAGIDPGGWFSDMGSLTSGSPV